MDLVLGVAAGSPQIQLQAGEARPELRLQVGAAKAACSGLRTVMPQSQRLGLCVVPQTCVQVMSWLPQDPMGQLGLTGRDVCPLGGDS